MNAVSAIFYRDYRLRRTNPFLIFWEIVAPLAYLLLFGIGYERMLGESLLIDGQSVRYTAFLVPGMLGLVTFGIAVNSSWGIFMDKDSGMAAEMLTYPLTRQQILTGKLGFNVLFALCSCTLVLTVGATAHDIPVHWEWVPMMIMATILAVVSLYFIFNAVAVKLDQMDTFNAVEGVMYVLMMFLSPMFYPLTKLPSWFQVLAYLNPLTWEIDLLRFGLLGLGGRTPLLIEGAALVVFTAGSLVIALRSLRRMA